MQQQLFDGLLEQLRIDNGEKLGCPFIISDEHVGVISGDDEGFYAALSVNYLMGSVNSDLVPHPSSSNKLFGALDMGGASTQLVFKPDSFTSSSPSEGSGEEMQQVEISMSSHDHMEVQYVNTLTTTDKNFSNTNIRRDDFFSQSFLSFGADTIREKLWSNLIHKSSKRSPSSSFSSSSSGLGEVANPCAFVGYEVEWEGKVLVGTGNAEACASEIRDVLFGDDCEHTSSSGGAYDDDDDDDDVEDFGHVVIGAHGQPLCPLDGHGALPRIEEGVEFVAMSIYFFALDCMRSLSHLLEDGDKHEHHFEFANEWPKPSIKSLFTASQPFCALSWAEISQPHVSHKWTWDDQMPHRCFENVFIATLLKEGYGIHPLDRSITYALEVDGMEVEWTLGYMLKVTEGN
jgi:hypothetical protein